MSTDELLAYVFDGQPHLLGQSISTWLVSSRRFAAFVAVFRDKIRKKLRITQEPESLLDLRFELETAYRLLQERSLDLVYESEQSKPGRGPDFAVTFTTRLTFMVEVTRLRGETREQVLATPSSKTRLSERLADAICGKLVQMLPQRSNVLVVGVESTQFTDGDLLATMLRLQQQAERGDGIFLQRCRFQDRADFFRYFQRLSEISVRGGLLPDGEMVAVWSNPQAKYPLPSKVRTVLHRTLVER